MEKRFPNLLALCLLLGLLAQIAILAQAWESNPLARLPQNDALVYWEWAGAIAGGKWVGDTPFLSAPLYPYLLGVLRLFGGGLVAVYAMQVLMHLATAYCLGMGIRRQLGARVALIGVLLWLTAIEPTFYTGRVLNCSLQLLLTAWTMERVSALWMKNTPARQALLGLAFGLTTLAHPPLIVAFPFLCFVVWRWLDAGLAGGLLTTFVAAATVLPATAHNYVASGELIPISAQAGVTFSHGNNTGATGIYSAAEGVSASRAQQNLDALDQARAELGQDAGWRDTDRYFFGQGLSWWKTEPLSALKVTARKLWYFLSGRHYGDIYVPAVERNSGMASLLHLAPIRSSWIILPGILGLYLLVRRERAPFRTYALLALIPLLVVVVFWYSPRYRIPVLPPLVVGAAWFIHHVKTSRKNGHTALAGACVLAWALALGPLNTILGFDTPDSLEANFEFQIGSVYLLEKDFENARAHLIRSGELGHPDATITLGDLTRLEHGAAGAIEALRAALEEMPDNLYAQRSLATALAENARVSGNERELAEARQLFEGVTKEDPNDWRAVMGLANVLLSSGEVEPAIEQYERAAILAPDALEVHFNLGVALASAGRTEEAIEPFQTGLGLELKNLGLRLQLVNVLVVEGRHKKAIAMLRDGLKVSPGHPEMTQALAFHLASAPLAEDRAGAEALRLMQDFRVTDEISRAVRLDTLAMALAETGKFKEAEESCREAMAVLLAEGEKDWAAEFGDRADLYAAGSAFRQ